MWAAWRNAASFRMHIPPAAYDSLRRLIKWAKIRPYRQAERFGRRRSGPLASILFCEKTPRKRKDLSGHCVGNRPMSALVRSSYSICRTNLELTDAAHSQAAEKLRTHCQYRHCERSETDPDRNEINETHRSPHRALPRDDKRASLLLAVNSGSLPQPLRRFSSHAPSRE